MKLSPPSTFRTAALLAALLLLPFAGRADTPPQPAVEDLHALFLFTNVDRKPDLQAKFSICIESLFRHLELPAGARVTLHFVADPGSKAYGEKFLQAYQRPGVQFVFHDKDEWTAKIFPIVEDMQKHFSSARAALLVEGEPGAVVEEIVDEHREIPLSIFWIAFSPDGAFAYASGFPSNRVSVIDTVTHATVATVPVGSFPTFVAVSPDGAFAYAANLTAKGFNHLSNQGRALSRARPFCCAMLCASNSASGS